MSESESMDEAELHASEEEEEEEDAQTQAERREANVRALVSNTLEAQRAPVMTKLNLSIEGVEKTLKRAFVSPLVGAPAASSERSIDNRLKYITGLIILILGDLLRRLAARKVFVPWGSNAPLKPFIPIFLNAPNTAQEAIALPEGIEPLVVWEAPPEATTGGSPIVVDPMLTRWLRPHQREGVQFMFECVTGQRVEGGQGCILADDMGLGKTLQAIALLWTLLSNGNDLLGGSPIARRAIIVCPTSLVSNWESECEKWLCGRLKCLALCEASRDDVVSSIASFLLPRQPAKVLIISYETFRIHAEKLHVPSACDILICDEAHRLKNDATLTNRALDALPCKRRVLLSGTPLQNDLAEFFAMVDFTNPGILGTASAFRRNFEAPILAGREPGATAQVVEQGSAQSAELSTLVNAFILRRTNALLSAHLPPKCVLVVCCRLSPMQQVLYEHFLASKATRKLIDAGKKGTAGVLSAITSLKKLCNHPKLIHDALNIAPSDKVKGKGKGGEGGGELAAGFKGVGDLFPQGVFDGGRGRSVESWMPLGGKMAVLSRLLHLLRTETRDRIVVVSNYTQTLDLIAMLCRERNYPVLRLDGSTGMSKRQKLVKEFCDQGQNQFVFLLSSKAGGCGLNLVGGNRLVLFDPDWNPATDKQAAGRVWRDGQKKQCYVYRFLSTGTIEEKVFQRQISKEGLQSLVSKNGKATQGKATASVMSESELKELFEFQADTLSNTFESMCHLEGNPPEPSEPGTAPHIFKAQVGKPTEEDMQAWGHHSRMETVPDSLLQRSACGDISFVFTCEVEGKLPLAAQGPQGPPPPPPPQPVRNPLTTGSSILPPSTSFKPPLPQSSAAAAATPGLKLHLHPPPASAATGKENVVAGPSSVAKRSTNGLTAQRVSKRPKASEVIEIDGSSSDEESMDGDASDEGGDESDDEDESA